MYGTLYTQTSIVYIHVCFSAFYCGIIVLCARRPTTIVMTVIAMETDVQHIIFLSLSLSVCVRVCAGNACVLKPSELSVATSNLFKELVPNYLDKVD